MRLLFVVLFCFQLAAPAFAAESGQTKELAWMERHPILTVGKMAGESTWHAITFPAKLFKKWIIAWELDYLNATQDKYTAGALAEEHHELFK